MAEFHSVVEVESAPNDGQIPVYHAATDSWRPGTAATAPITVPQTGIAQAADPSAATASAVTQADAAAQGVGYVEADVQSIADLANALKVALNDAIADNAALSATVEALTDIVNSLLAELQTAAILSAP